MGVSVFFIVVGCVVALVVGNVVSRTVGVGDNVTVVGSWVCISGTSSPEETHPAVQIHSNNIAIKIQMEDTFIFLPPFFSLPASPQQQNESFL